MGVKFVLQEPNNRVERLHRSTRINRVSIVFHMSVSKPLVRNLSTKSLPEAIKAYTEFSADMSQTKEEMRRRLQPELSSA